ncbi:MAG: aminotransferase class V-fold PLP-dependent enzyme [Spirochaetales bacterium]|jgi:cysteine desulfurase / selenocysteine lyase|nr:aminotransferase class V-fold PLP-dependent enzyme [Spirochaetales bacterium]
MGVGYEITEIRKLFPVTQHWTYLYNGSIHPCPTPVADAMRSFLTQWQNGGEAAFFPAFEGFERLKEKFASLINTHSRNIVVTESTTSGINLAAQILRPEPHQNVVVTDLAFMSNTYLWLAGKSPIETRFVQSRSGRVAIEDLARQIDNNTAAVHICAVTVGSGFRYNLDEVYAETSQRGVPLIIDGAQALGLVDLNASDPPLDFLATTASKWLMGPTGVGFLHVHDKYLNSAPPAPGWLAAANVGDWDVRRCQLHDDATRFQGGIPNLIGVVGALAGLEFIESIGREFMEKRVHTLTTYLIEELTELGVEILTPTAPKERAGIVFFRLPRCQEVHLKLKEAKIYCGCFQNGIRVDPGFYNTEDELDQLIGIVKTNL